MGVPYDLGEILALRADGATWQDIAPLYDRAPNTVSEWFAKQMRNSDEYNTPGEDLAADPGIGPETDQVLLTKEQVERITTLDELIEFFKVDTDRWMVQNFRVNKWEQNSNAQGIVPLYQVKANLVRNLDREAELAAEAMRQAAEDMRTHVPAYPGPFVVGHNEPVLFELALMDPHLGMLAWAAETGNDYDLDIAMRDYERAGEALMDAAHQHQPERILLVVGNDTIHIDTFFQGKVGTTTAGTPQDFDSRLPKLFTSARRAIVNVIDMALDVADNVDVMVVGGNHDEHSMYKLGEVLSAWYRECDRVAVLNAPRLRKYYTYGKNLLGFTHGQEFKRKREPLALIMMDEAAREGIDLRKHPVREWHVGHYHATAELEHMSPRKNLSETRGIRIRALPGLTASDAWHVREGYGHLRAATGLVFRKTGGLAALHEFHPGLEE